MPSDFTTQHYDYVQRIGLRLPELPKPMPRGIAARMRRLQRITEVGYLDMAEGSAIERSPARIAGHSHVPSRELLVGMYKARRPLVLRLWGEPDEIGFHLGSWGSDNAGDRPECVTSIPRIVGSLVRTCYPAVKMTEGCVEMNLAPRAGLVLGVPVGKPPGSLDIAQPVDRLVRGMRELDRGTREASWECLILAEPMEERCVMELYHSVLNEISATAAAVRSVQAPRALADRYIDLLALQATSFIDGAESGLWRTAVYLLGDEISYPRLAAVWCSVFSGNMPRTESQKAWCEPLRVWDDDRVAALAVDWAMPNVQGPPAPGYYQIPHGWQTVLTSAQLAEYIHLPRLETKGLKITAVVDLDAVPPPIPWRAKDRRVLQLGQVIHRGELQLTPYEISLASMNQHTFVAGVTGSGKSYTIKHLLVQAAAHDVPFLVVEPAKAEYRALLNTPGLEDKLTVFTLGNENCAPFRLNPFEVLDGASVGVHLDMLRSVFTASFGMWAPLPQVLEQCLYRAYADRGWDLTTGRNRRLETADYGTVGDSADVFPTLSDLLVQVDVVSSELGYEQKVVDNIRSALRTRITALRTGGKGRMLDVQRSLPMKSLLEHSAVLELEGVGDDDDKAFIMGLLFIRLVEYRRSQGQKDALEHLLIIEEAHRLLSNVSHQGSAEEGNPRGKAVETFVNLLAEIRAYGQGVVVVDQVPVKLAPDVMKNSNLKIAHRIVAEDDRRALSGTMALSRQHDSLARLVKGEAIVFTEGDDRPLMVRVDPKDSEPPPEREFTALAAQDLAPQKKPPDLVPDERVHSRWEQFVRSRHLETVFRVYPTCQYQCRTDSGANCANARQIAGQPAVEETFARFVLTLVTFERFTRPRPSDFDLRTKMEELYEDLQQAIFSLLANRTEDIEETRCVLTHALYKYMHRRGAQYGCKYSQVSRLIRLLLPTLLVLANHRKRDNAADDSAVQISQGWSDKVIDDLREFATHYADLCSYDYPPFGGCEQTCSRSGSTQSCLYRYNVAAFLGRNDFESAFGDTEHNAAKIRIHIERYANWVIGGDQESEPFRQVLSCFAIQRLHSDPAVDPNSRMNTLEDFFELNSAAKTIPGVIA